MASSGHGVRARVPAPAHAQLALRPPLQASPQPGAISQGELRGVVQDDRGCVAGRRRGVGDRIDHRVRRLGSTKAGSSSAICLTVPICCELTCRDICRRAPGSSRSTVLAPTGRWRCRRSMAKASPSVLAAGIGRRTKSRRRRIVTEEHDHDEVAWRLRHLKRSVLKRRDARGARYGKAVPRRSAYQYRARGWQSDAPGIVAFRGCALQHANQPADDDVVRSAAGSVLDQCRHAAGRGLRVGGRANGRRRVDDSRHADPRRRLVMDRCGILFAAVERPAIATKRGCPTRTQRYLGGNAEALNAVRDGARNVGSMYASDDWSFGSRVHVGYGAKFASYDYLTDGSRPVQSARQRHGPAVPG